MSLTLTLAAYLKARPHQWIEAKQLEFAGRQAWRTRLSNCRTELHMTIENRQERHETADGRRYTLSFYRYVPPQPASLLDLLDAHSGTHVE